MKQVDAMTYEELLNEFFQIKLPSETAAQEWYWRNRASEIMRKAWNEVETENPWLEFCKIEEYPGLRIKYMRLVISGLRGLQTEFNACEI